MRCLILRNVDFSKRRFRDEFLGDGLREEGQGTLSSRGSIISDADDADVGLGYQQAETGGAEGAAAMEEFAVAASLLLVAGLLLADRQLFAVRLQLADRQLSDEPE